MESNNPQNFLGLIEQANSILIASHAGPDPDAISATIFTLQILQKKYPEKKIVGNIEGVELSQFRLLFDISIISSDKFTEAIEKNKPELLIVLDMNELRLLSREDAINTLNSFRSNGKIVQIDHHMSLTREIVDLYFNESDNSCAETVYKIFIQKLKFEPYQNYANELLLGIVGDTGSFGYLKDESDIQSTFSITYELLKDGGNIDEVRTYIGRITSNQLLVHKEYLNNLKYNDEYSHTYISDSFFMAHPEIGDAEYSIANKTFVQWYLKSINEAFWGFSIKPLRKGEYTFSLRAPIGKIDLTKFALAFNGGGHKAAAGGLIKAKNDKEATQQVIEVIEKYKEEAYANK